MPFEGGPYIQVACFCENIIEDKAGVISLIRIIDTITHTAAGPAPPEVLPPFPYALKLIIMLKSGKARGRSNLRMVPELPTGASLDPITLTVHFEGEEKGQNIITNVALTFEHEGLYWFRLFLDDQLLTSLPLRIKYNRVVVGPTPAQA